MIVWPFVLAYFQIMLLEPASVRCHVRGSKQEIMKRASPRDVGRDSRPVATSHDLSPAAGFGGKLIDSGEIFLLQIGVLIKDLRLGHASAQPAENVPDGDAQATHAR